MTAFPPYNAPMKQLTQSLSGRRPQVSVVSFVRPADTTAYAVGDVIFPGTPGTATSLVFPDVVDSNGESAVIVSASLVLLSAQGTALAANLTLFSGAPGVAPVDNAALALTGAQMKTRQTTISFSGAAASNMGGFTEYEVALNKPFQCAANSRNLHGILVARNLYTPVSAEEFVIQLGIVPRAVAYV